MYSEQSAYYEAFSTGYWSSEDPETCPCHGQGWVLSELDTWHQCPVHYKKGQGHPDDAAVEEAAADFIPAPGPKVTSLGEGDDIPF